MIKFTVHSFSYFVNRKALKFKLTLYRVDFKKYYHTIARYERRLITLSIERLVYFDKYQGDYETILYTKG